jgi:hypothetical protein
MIKTREESEKMANSATMPRNQLLASDLIDLLDERQKATSTGDLDRLAARHGIDREVLESLSRFVNSPTSDLTTRRKILGEDGSENVLTTVSLLPFWFPYLFLM